MQVQGSSAGIKLSLPSHMVSMFNFYFSALSANKALVQTLCRVPVSLQARPQPVLHRATFNSHQVPRGTVLRSKSNADHQIKVEPLKQSLHCVVCPYEPSYESYLCFISQHNGQRPPHNISANTLSLRVKQQPVSKLFQFSYLETPSLCRTK